MSANIPVNMRLDDLLKATGYNCPEELQGKTFDEATSGGSSASLEDNKEVEITENGTVEITPSEGYDGMKKVTATVNVAGGGGGELNFNSSIIPYFMLEAEEGEWNVAEIFAISENGDFIDSVENISQAQFLIYYSVSGSYVFRKNDSDTVDLSIYPSYVDNCDFTITDGKITLPNTYDENTVEYTVTSVSNPEPLGYWLLPAGS